MKVGKGVVIGARWVQKKVALAVWATPDPIPFHLHLQSLSLLGHAPAKKVGLGSNTALDMQESPLGTIERCCFIMN